MMRWIVLLLALSAGILPANAQMLFRDGFGRPPSPMYQSEPQAPAYQQRQRRTARRDPALLPVLVQYPGISAGEIRIDTNERKLYFGLENDQAIRYSIGVGRQGFGWQSIDVKVADMKEWPYWHPPDEMRERRPDLPKMVAPGPDNPLGPRALYLHGSVLKSGKVVGGPKTDTLYRIHGTNEQESIGTAASSGCFRMMNDDVIDLYSRVKVGAKVTVL